jgi:hypothetical protein
MKTSKAALREAVDSFLYVHRDLTGGTIDEIRKQAPAGLIHLRKLAAEVATLAANPNKHAASDAHLMEYARELIPAKLASYEERWILTPEPSKKPDNVILISIHTGKHDDYFRRLYMEG